MLIGTARPDCACLRKKPAMAPTSDMERAFVRSSSRGGASCRGAGGESFAAFPFYKLSRLSDEPSMFTLNPKLYTLHPTPYTLHPAPYTLHPTPYTLHPTPYTPHHTPYI